MLIYHTDAALSIPFLKIPCVTVTPASGRAHAARSQTTFPPTTVISTPTSDLFLRHGEVIAIEHRQISQLAGLDRALEALLAGQPCAGDRVRRQRLAPG